MKRMYDLSGSSIEKLKNQAKNNGRTITSELNRILNALPDVKKEAETVQPIKKSGNYFFTPGKTYFNEQKEECTYIKSYDNDMGIFKNHEYNNECTYEYIDMYIDSAFTKKVIQ